MAKGGYFLRALMQWAIILGVIGILIYIYLPGYSRYYQLHERETALEKKIKDLEEKISVMQEEKYLLENDVTHLEKVVRERLGRVEPGETVYKIVDEPVVVGEGYQIHEADSMTTPAPEASGPVIPRETNKV